MRAFVCSVYDSKSSLFMLPKYYVTLGVAERQFTEEVNQADSYMFKYPEDYSLFHLGYFDDETGAFENLTAPVSLVKAMQVKKDGKTE